MLTQQQLGLSVFSTNNINTAATGTMIGESTNPATSVTPVAVLLNDYDVLCGRDKEAFNYTGNRRFRVTLGLSLGRFMEDISRKEKNTLIKSILTIVQGNGGRFLEFKKNAGWTELTTKKAHRKVGHALRDMALVSRNENIKKTASDSAGVVVTNDHEVVVPPPTAVTAVVPSTTLCRSNHNDDQSLDPLDLLEAIPANEFTFDTTNNAGEDIDMLQWLVGESDGLFHHFPPPPEPETKVPTEPNPSSRRNSLELENGEFPNWLVDESNTLELDTD